MEHYTPSKAIAAAYRLSQSILRAKLATLSIEAQQADSLYVISNREGLSQQELSGLLSVSKSATTQAVKNMIAAGYVRKEVDAMDKRVSRLYLTEEGKAIAPRINEVFGELIDLHQEAFSAEERKQFEQLITKLVDELREKKSDISAKE
ncbi:MarR family winged helix-turn-helix transcriptional regulator [Raoultibacter phocaeensis]|uniref:MarR family winged helix-turn-helix transcriptional regulator n=1 Tax=Raoultibacter phocaeensis TaxID=2479841 RepID=UPI00111A575C|nr:MarR family transcriptional regulator [Raoultibacter phocaeensis]